MAAPLWVTASVAAALVGLIFAGAALGALLLGRSRAGAPWRVLVALGAAELLTVGAAAEFGRRSARQLRALRADALRAADSPATAGGGGDELRRLSGAIEALRLRVRLSDEMADRHREAARTASAGMSELLSGLVAAEEGARGQLAAELHDTVAQTLSSARRLLVDGEHWARAADLVTEAEEQVRAVMARTRPPALQEGDLATAVSLLGDDLLRRYGLAVQLSWPQRSRPLPLATAVTVYRFFQEALLNVVKHSSGDTASVRLDLDAGGLLAVVRDTGPGFDPNLVRAEHGHHVGLALLRERARLAGGGLEIASSPGQPTTLTLRLPAPEPGGSGPGRVITPRRSEQAPAAAGSLAAPIGSGTP